MEEDPIQAFAELWKACNADQKRLIAELVNRPETWVGIKPPCPYEEIKKLYNRKLHMLLRKGKTIQVLTSRRQMKIKQLWSYMSTLKEWESYFDMIGQSRWLTGQISDFQGRTYMADFDWVMNENNWVKVIEGKYS